METLTFDEKNKSIQLRPIQTAKPKKSPKNHFPKKFPKKSKNPQISIFFKPSKNFIPKPSLLKLIIIIISHNSPSNITHKWQIALRTFMNQDLIKPLRSSTAHRKSFKNPIKISSFI